MKLDVLNKMQVRDGSRDVNARGSVDVTDNTHSDEHICSLWCGGMKCDIARAELHEKCGVLGHSYGLQDSVMFLHLEQASLSYFTSSQPLSLIFHIST